ncbi:MAG: hypothetical protein KA974_10595 [Saprospiraceae bacterium]|nr:hypothetical protein [Saprospiraceae bacterium]
MNRILSSLLLITCIFIGCKPENESVFQEDEDLNLGGTTSISGTYIQIFQQPAANLNAAELDFHRAADKAFGDRFVSATNFINGGLGPIFNQNSCENCHTSNGRSAFPASNNELRGLLMRVSIDGTNSHGEPLSVPNFGGQLQTKAIFGQQPEVTLTWQEVEEIKHFIDGEAITLSKPAFSIMSSYLPIPNNMMMSPRIAPPVIGLGLLEAIPESDILALADPNDNNADGISGKPNYVWNYIQQVFDLGRFGWKAGQPNLLQQTAGAYKEDMGVTNPLFSVENCYGQSQLDTLQDEPEIDDLTLKAATFYTQSLAVPQRRNTTNITVAAGKKIFFDIQCQSCHHPKFVTGTHPEYSFLNNQTIFPYTDLLLHDMGEGLADNRPEFVASGNEWRTPPLWGLGLTKIVGGQQANYLHDGRAKTLEEAIMWHGGEAENSKERFRKLSKTERNALIKFLESL